MLEKINDDRERQHQPYSDVEPKTIEEIQSFKEWMHLVWKSDPQRNKRMSHQYCHLLYRYK